jgi:hypothetical protein
LRVNFSHILHILRRGQEHDFAADGLNLKALFSDDSACGAQHIALHLTSVTPTYP